jgi:hypothetical protein
MSRRDEVIAQTVQFELKMHMNNTIVKRPIGRPRGTTVGINERLERYRISERCAEFTNEILDFWVDVLRNPLAEVKRDGKSMMVRKYTVEQQFMASDRLMDCAYGKAPVVAQVDQNKREMAVRRIVVSWLPPDPNDTSKHIPPEPD